MHLNHYYDIDRSRPLSRYLIEEFIEVNYLLYGRFMILHRL